MNPYSVNPAVWTDHEVIFNDANAEFSAVWGKFRGKYCLGTRWNGEIHERGYPGQGQYPLWFVEPDFLALSILQRLYLEAMRRNLQNPSGQLYCDKIAIAIDEFIELHYP